MRAAAALLALLVGAADASAQSVTDKVDRFSGDRSVKYQGPDNFGQRQPKVSAAVFTKNRQNDGYILLAVSTYSGSKISGWRYLECNRVNWLLDGKPFDLGTATHRGDATTTGTIEHLILHATPTQMGEIGRASSVEFRICTDEFSLTSDDIAGIRQVAEKFVPSAP